MKKAIVLGGLLLALTVSADTVKYWSDTPVTCHWIGKVKRANTSQADYNDGYYPFPQAPYAQWTNHNNWAEGIVPGRFEVVLEDGTIVTNGSLGCTAVFDGNCDISCIDLSGMVSVSNIVVTGESAPHFVFGHRRWDNPYLGIEAGGGIRVTAEVPEAPYVWVQIIPHNATPNCNLITFENNSSKPLNVGYVGKIFPPASSWYGALKIIFKGTGSVIKRNKNYNTGWGATMLLDMNGGEYVSHSVTSATSGFGSLDNYYYVRDVDNGFRQKILLPEGKMITIDEKDAIRTEAGMDVSGDGVLYLSKRDVLPCFCAAKGKSLDISADVWRCAEAGAGFEGIQVGYNEYPGTVRLSGENTFMGPVSVVNGATLEVPRLGYGDENGPVGRIGVQLSNKSFIRYVGNGETTDRTLSGSGYGSVILAGSGDLVWKGEISGGTTYHYTITNESATARFVCANKSIEKFLNLVEGTRLGFSKPDDSDSISVAKISVGGNVSIDLIDGVTVKIDEFTRTSGNILVNSAPGAVLKIPSLAEGFAPDWLTVNGKATYISPSGDVFAIDERQNDLVIAARGDVVPHAPGKVVGITTAGAATSGNDVLEENVTTVLTLNHETEEDAVVEVSEGQTLNVNLIQIKPGAGDLAIGNVKGMGFVSAESNVFETRVADADSVLAINSAMDVPPSVPVNVYGAGTTVFSAFNGYEGLLNLFDAKVVMTNSVNVSAAKLSGTGTFDFSGGVMRLAASDEDGVDAVYESDNPVSIAVTGGVLRLTGEKPLPVQEIRVPHGELVLDGVNLHTPGFSMDMTETPRKTLIVGSNGTAVVRLNTGSVTGSLELASWVSAVTRAAMYQSGGEFVNITPYAESYAIGVKGYAYYNLSGGRYVAAGDWYLGATGEGLLDISGGELYHTPASVRQSRCRIGGWDGFASLRVANGGVFNATNVAAEVIMPGYNRSEAMGECTVEDGGAILLNKEGLTLGRGYSASYCHSVLNLNGGLFVSPRATRVRASVYPSEEWPEGKADKSFGNTYVFVNCNGGTFRTLVNGAIFGSRGSEWAYPPNRVTLYERGLTIDSNGMDCRLEWGGGLQAPSGQGVVSVAWDAEKDGKGFVGSPFIRIVGDGMGATAWADFDPETMTVTGIHVTSPGNDYTYANAELVMNKKVVKTVPCTVGPNVSGGLTKIGRAALKISATNTYEGATVVKAGSILLAADDVISSKSKLVLDGGDLDMNGKHQVFSSVEVTENGGSVVNGTLTLSGLTVDFNDVLAGKSLVYDGEVAFAAGAKFTLLNANKVPAPSPFGYRLAEIKRGIATVNLNKNFR